MNIYSLGGDSTSDEVIEYMNYIGMIHSTRIQCESKIKNISIYIGNNTDFVSFYDSNLKEIRLGRKESWMRRGMLSIFLNQDLNKFPNSVKQHLKGEVDFLRDYIYDYTTKLGSFSKEINNNRLYNTLLAKEFGLKIPSTLVADKKSNLLDFFDQTDTIIVKPIHNGHLNFTDDKMRYNCLGTRVVSKKDLGDLDEYFLPSLFQEYITKNIEIRSFYLKGEFYSMAIFSQLDSQTELDYRNYNLEKPNRTVPYKLPESIILKLKKLMAELNLDTGSIDMILDRKNEYVFLEVNPTGQFGWLSKSCNYYIEKEVAKHMLS